MYTTLFGTSDHFKSVSFVRRPDISRCEAGRREQDWELAAEASRSFAPFAPGQGEPCLPKFCLEPQAQLVSCFSRPLDMATAPNASPLAAQRCMSSFLCRFRPFSTWFILCRYPQSVRCNPDSAVAIPRPLTHLFVTECSLAFPPYLEASSPPRAGGSERAGPFSQAPNQSAGRQQESSPSFPLLLCIFSWFFLGKPLPSLRLSYPSHTPSSHCSCDGGHWSHVPIKYLKRAMCKCFPSLRGRNIKCLKIFILIMCWNVTMLWIYWISLIIKINFICFLFLKCGYWENVNYIDGSCLCLLLLYFYWLALA